MSRVLGREIPEVLRRELDSPRMPKVAVPLVSLDPDGFPHVALLSFLEVLIEGGETFFFLYGGSRTCEFLRSRPQCTLLFVRKAYCFYLKGRANHVLTDQDHSVFRFRPVEVLADDVPEEERETRLTSGVRFRLSQQEEERRLAFREQLRKRLSKTKRSPKPKGGEKKQSRDRGGERCSGR